MEQCESSVEMVQCRTGAGAVLGKTRSCAVKSQSCHDSVRQRR